MGLDRLQRELLAAFFRTPTSFFLTGGAALSGYYLDHRETLDLIERRSQQVWIPVTVATLVPGVMFLAVPFIEAMRLFTDH